MPRSVQRIGDANFLGGVILEGDSTVLVNFRPVAVLGAPVSPHPCCGAVGCPPIHCAAVTTTSSATVLINGRPIVTTGDVDTCGDVRGLGSTTVFVGL